MSQEAPQLDPVTQHPHLEEHPNAVQDPALAQEMAIAGHPHESEAARLRQHGEKQLQERLVKDPGTVPALAAVNMNMLVPKINRENMQADQKYAEVQMQPHDYAADARASLEATKR